MTSKKKKKTTPSLDHDSPKFNSTKDKTTNQRIKEYESLIAPSERFGKIKYKEQNHTQQLKTTETTSTAAAASNLSEEELLRKCRVDEDPIKHWEQYIEYIQQIYPNDSHLYFDILERCTYSLLHHPKYKNDDRFIQFIVIYADQLDDDSIKERQFRHYYKLKVGTNTAIFWISWAFITEKRKDYAATNRIYEKAMKVDAKPRNILMQRYDLFLRRMNYYKIEYRKRKQSPTCPQTPTEQGLIVSCNTSPTNGRNEVTEKQILEKGIRKAQCDKNNNIRDEAISKSQSTSMSTSLSTPVYTSNDTLSKRLFTIYDENMSTQQKRQRLDSSNDTSSKVSTLVHDNTVSMESKLGHYNEISTNQTEKIVPSQTSFTFQKHMLYISENDKSFEECRAETGSYRLIDGGKTDFNKIPRVSNRKIECKNKSDDDDNLDATMKYSSIDSDHLVNNKSKACNQHYHENNEKGTNYNSLHVRNTTESLSHILEIATTDSINNCYGVDNLILDLKPSKLPNGLKKISTKGMFKVSIGDQNLVVKNRLGSGVYGTVILCSISSSTIENFALKVQTGYVDTLAWEYNVLERVRHRLQYSTNSRVKRKGNKNVEYNSTVPRALSFAVFSDGAVMGMTCASETGLNLLDIVNAHKGSVPELLAIHYTSKMLKHLETLHLRAKILHCDIKPDNWVLTTPEDGDSNPMNLASDVMLVDFGRAVDLIDVTKNGLHGNIAAQDLESPSMRSNRNWSYDIDAFGVCVCASTILYGSYVEVRKDHSSRQWCLAKPLRRYWQKQLWNMLFSAFLNLRTPVTIDEYSSKLSKIRMIFDRYLAHKGRKAEIASMLIAQRSMLPKRKT